MIGLEVYVEMDWNVWDREFIGVLGYSSFTGVSCCAR